MQPHRDMQKVKGKQVFAPNQVKQAGPSNPKLFVSPHKRCPTSPVAINSWPRLYTTVIGHPQPETDFVPRPVLDTLHLHEASAAGFQEAALGLRPEDYFKQGVGVRGERNLALVGHELPLFVQLPSRERPNHHAPVGFMLCVNVNAGQSRAIKNAVGKVVGQKLDYRAWQRHDSQVATPDPQASTQNSLKLSSLQQRLWSRCIAWVCPGLAQ